MVITYFYDSAFSNRGAEYNSQFRNHVFFKEEYETYHHHVDII